MSSHAGYKCVSTFCFIYRTQQYNTKLRRLPGRCNRSRRMKRTTNQLQFDCGPIEHFDKTSLEECVVSSLGGSNEASCDALLPSVVSGIHSTALAAATACIETVDSPFNTRAATPQNLSDKDRRIDEPTISCYTVNHNLIGTPLSQTPYTKNSTNELHTSLTILPSYHTTAVSYSSSTWFAWGSACSTKDDSIQQEKHMRAKHRSSRRCFTARSYHT